MRSGRQITFPSVGAACSATHLTGTGDDFRSETGRPCVVMAHGFGGTRDTGLSGYAHGFAAAGLDVLLFDYRGFAASSGTPRQVVSHTAQREDYHAAIAEARRLPGVDPDRIVLWGTSYSGGHVVPVGVRDGRIAAAISMTPAMDGAAAMGMIATRAGVRPLLNLARHGLIDISRRLRGRVPHLVPVAAEPGELGFLTAPGALAGYTAIAGPTWRNEVAARAALESAFNRPVAHARRVRFPLFVQIGTRDQTVPASAARRVAALAGPHATASEYPVDHFDVYAGAWQERLLADQLDFLRQRLGAPVAANAPATTLSAGNH
ncbi:MAG: alpha/beta hydrolase [Actinomycetales bacterium]